MTPPVSRRRFVAASAFLSAGAVAGRAAAADTSRAAADPAYRIRNHGIRHTVMGWCFNPMDTLELARHAKAIGLEGIEGIDRKYYSDVKKLGLEISLVSSHGFAEGPCNPRFFDQAVAKLAEGIEVAKEVGSKKVITFTGMRFDGMDEEQGAADCIAAWKKVLPQAEAAGITLCLEHLNSRDSSHPMKGHPGYFGDDVDFCVDLVTKVGSPNLKVLFDVYHVSIMNGDIIRRLRQHADSIGHIHTAGNPGRGELDDTQEIDYPAVMRALSSVGYHDFVAHEFLPTWDDPILALRHAAMVCDV
ncbi:MAG: Hydroxypyruvate isomerase [Planctomycetota bacterium]|jgi:hydroxypyruvate isomerase